LQVDSSIPLAPRYDQPRYFSHNYIVDGDSPDKNKSRLQVNWLVAENADPSLTMALSILSFALVSTPASPLRKALIDSGLGDDLTGGGLSGNLRELTFGVGLKGIDSEDAGQVEKLILDKLRELADSGFEQDMIEAAVNSIEFQLRENNTGRFPRGLSLMLSAMGTWNYDGDPLAMIAYEAPLQAVKERLDQDPDYLQDLLRTYFLQNPHRTTVKLDPDPKLGEKLEREERDRLAEAKAKMEERDLKAIIDNANELKRRQETPDSPVALAAIPTLTLADLDRENKPIPKEIEEIQGSEILFHDLFTNGIVYLDVGFDLHALEADLLPFVNLLGNSLTKMGTEELDYVKLSQRINQKTGGVWHSILTSSTTHGRDAAAWFLLRGKATMERAQDLLEIFQDILLSVKLDDQTRFRQIVLEAKAGEEAGIIQMGHVVVGNRLAAQFNEADWAAERMGGIDYLHFLNKLIREIENDWPAVQRKLEEVHQALVSRQTMVLNVTLDEENYGLIKPRLESFVRALPATSTSIASWSPSL
ncbi:MAG: insulinase family protein, partial [Nitrospirales bacterium]|nr:insulinase family protein [Nitrospirales bacterium]